ncbi:molybdopterin biosynthesis protein [Tepidimicrobium xylanilyticum]|uniref:Molybdopterin molybdenumtransferase n=1 Tax=Tepidimicrobium xylanilyticum TaxID=1123352 RepID=A0A1H3AW98_9FIRM|nr:molybdopterin biosynthesis protein [Tepidimicrobium xylanilyticum]SDX33986.1 putative molybdopterin biosynthesis protein [Tepidimicrobium xylanilyticum]
MNNKRNIYIDNIDVDVAKKEYFDKLNIKAQWEEIDVVNSLGRVTFEAVYARLSSPNYNAAAMDGILVESAKTIGATEINPKTLEEGKDFLYINTGNPVVDPYDAVIMIEDVIQLGDGKVQILKAAHPWQHIRPIGEDIVATEMILPSKHKIRPIDIGALISGGIEKVRVYKKPKVGILPTGSEIIEEIKELETGKIIDSNSRVFEALTVEAGGLPKRYSPIEDDYEKIKEAVLKGVEENDILLIGAGSSAGSKDYTANVIEELGEVIIHGVALKPGKPTILGIINGKPVMGIPGYPVSAYLVFETFVTPIILKYIGLKEEKDTFVDAIISKKITSTLKSRELIRVNLGYVKDKLIATPLSSGAGVTMSLVKADGIAIIPQSLEGVDAGGSVKVKLLKPLNRIKETLVSIGSHDMIMDILGDMVKLSSGHVGSMGGILAMKRGECHIAPIHLLDLETGEYNISYVERYFPGQKMALIKGVKRHQGFIVEKGNPKGIKDFSDLVREDVVYVNRQRGAGTRILLDYHLNKENIDPANIRGYDREMTTHMAVATAVKTGSASVGLGIYSAAKALDLDFIDIAYEDYDFLLPYELLEDERVKEFIRTLKSQEFKERVEALGGYGFENIGEIIIVK